MRVGIFSPKHRSPVFSKNRQPRVIGSFFRSAHPAPQSLPSTPLRILRSQFEHHAYAIRTNLALGALLLAGAASHAAMGFGTLGASILWTPTAAAAAWYKVIKPRWRGFVSFRALVKNFSAEKRSIIKEILELYETFTIELSYARAILQQGKKPNDLPGETRLADFGFRRSEHPMDREFYEGSVKDYLEVWVGKLERAMGDFENTIRPDSSAKQLSAFWQQKSRLLDDYCSGLLDLEG